MRILVDVDDVIAEICEPVLNFVNEKLDLKDANRFVYDDIKQYDICIALGHPELTPYFIEQLGKENFCKNLEVIKGSQDTIKELQKNHKIYVVTSPFYYSKFWMYERTNWLVDNFGFSTKNIVHTAAKELIQGDILIDDRLDNINSWASANPLGFGLLWDTPYNQCENLQYHVIRVKSWDDVKRSVKIIGKAL